MPAACRFATIDLNSRTRSRPKKRASAAKKLIEL